MGAKRALSQVRNTDNKKIPLSKEKFAKKLFFLQPLHPLLVKVCKSESTSFHFKDYESLNFLDI